MAKPYSKTHEHMPRSGNAYPLSLMRRAAIGFYQCLPDRHLSSSVSRCVPGHPHLLGVSNGRTSEMKRQRRTRTFNPERSTCIGSAPCRQLAFVTSVGDTRKVSHAQSGSDNGEARIQRSG